MPRELTPKRIVNSIQVNEFAQEIADTIARCEEKLGKEVVVCVALQIACDYGRMWKGDDYLENLAALCLARKQVEMPDVKPGGIIGLN